MNPFAIAALAKRLPCCCQGYWVYIAPQPLIKVDYVQFTAVQCPFGDGVVKQWAQMRLPASPEHLMRQFI